MKEKRWLAASAVLLMAALHSMGCGAGSHDAGSVVTASEASSGAGTTSNMRTVADTTQPVQHRAFMRRATLRLRVESVERVEKEVQSTIQALGGYVERAASSDLDGKLPQIEITVRVPEEKFSAAMEALESKGVRLAKTIEGEDVTTQIVDIQARLQVMRAQEDSYRKMLQNSTNLGENMQISDKLMQLRGTIESQAAQLKTLASLASLSTITVALQQSAEASAIARSKSDPSWFSETLAGATSSFMTAFRVAVAVLVWTILFIPFWAPVAWLVWRTSRRRGREQFEL